MERVKAGMMAWSRAGHDRGKLYVIVEVGEEFVWLSDGRLRPLDNPKKKRWKHIQVRKQIPEELRGLLWEQVRNEEIRRSIKAVQQEISGGRDVKSRCN